MKSRQLKQGGARTYELVLEPGDEAVTCLNRFVCAQGLGAARFTALGGFSEIVLGFFALDGDRYVSIPIQEPLELSSLVGDVTVSNGEPKVHPRVVITRADGSAWGGELLEAYVRPSLQVLLSEHL
ncbi:MAG TPA: DUF296 domain-containing protein [Steroidobacteraceae bacterium]|nr:DUF296 domain-containing protein [Steroidobacteraceae bacterium]